MDALCAARRAVALERAGLAALEAWLGEAGDHPFRETVERVLALDGRLVVSGIGKSGHVGRKIAATLASTGTPAMFVHATEASHGDLGMISRSDAVLALSKSGETAELSDLVHYTRRFGILLIAMTCRADSALARAADIRLVLPDAAEAAAGTNAPTTSTTMMIALGDALAVALIERRGFDAEAFGIFHPGGRLGAQLRTVADLMHTGDEVPLVADHTMMRDALLVMTAKRFGCAGVVDTDGRMIGLVTDGDLRRHMGPELLARTAGEVMTRNPLTVAPTTLAAEALRLMNERGVTQLFALDDKRPAGIIHVHDCLRAGVV
jgi:arabinose-5-phosphate isomerase